MVPQLERGHTSASASDRRAQFLVVSLGLLIGVTLLPFLTGLLGALVLSVMLGRPKELLAVRLGQRPAAACITLLAAVLIVLPGVWLAMTITAEAPATLYALEHGRLVSSITSMRVGNVDVGAVIAESSAQTVAWLSGALVQLAGGTVRATINLVIALFGLYFLLIAPRDAWLRVARYLPFSAEGVERLRQRFYLVTEATLFGTALVALLQGTIVGVGFALVGFPSPVFWGVVTAAASVLPVMGSALVWVPGVIVLVANQRYGAALALALIGGGLASNIDNVARLMINRRVSGLHPMLTLVGAFAGVRALGVAGVLLGPLALSYFFELVNLYEEEHGAETRPASAALPPPPRDSGINVLSREKGSKTLSG
jgi:predicted PurR-regulated permease PerM